MSNIPKKFVGLHSHALSIFDSIGSPKEHIDFALKNGMDSLALTDHGHQTGFAEQFSYSQKLTKQGVKFKGLFGVEAYFIPSLKDWNNLYEENKRQKQEEKKQKKASKKAKELLDTDEEAAEAEVETIAEDKDEASGTVIENEEESKSNSYKNPLYQRNHLVLIAKNSEGLKSIFRIVSESNMNGFYRYPRVDFDMLKTFSKGNIIASTACIAGYPAKIVADNQVETDWKLWQPNDTNFELIQSKLKDAIERFKEALGEENYYLELQFNKLGYQHLVNYHLIEASKRTNTPLVITADAHYSNPDHWKEREIYKLLGFQSKNKDKENIKDAIPSKIEELKCELYPKNAEQIWESYKRYGEGYDFYDDQIISEATERTWEIAHNQIGKVDVDRRVKLPSIHKLVSKKNIEKFQGENKELDEDVVALKELKELCIEGLKKKGKGTNQEYIDRLKMELDVIKHLKLAKYFLTTKKMLDIIRDKQIIGFGRGSGAGSLINYLLEITGVDSIKYDLLFQRFLNKKKAGAADIDNDVSNRDVALTLVKDYFGEENVIPISAFSQLQIASLIKDLAKLYGLPFEEVNEYTNKMRNEALAVAKQEPGFDAQQWVFTLDVAEKDSPSFKLFMEKVKDYPDFEKALKVLFKQPRQITRHAGGVLLTDNAKDNMPLIRTNGEIQTPWADGLGGRNLEDYGFLKFDILGIGTLRMFEDCIRRILKKEGKQYVSFYDIKRYFNEKLHPDVNNFDDMNVYEHVYWNKNYAGVFQFVKANVQNFTADLKPTNIIDLAAITSIFRPGPLSADVDKLFLRNRKNPEDIEYVHPKLKDLLKDTGGLIIFQEQAQLIFHLLAGYDLDETDKFRKLLNKKDLSKKEETTKELNDFKETFAQKSLEYSDLRIDKGRELFDIIKLYSSYSFNKSHAVSYAINSYLCAWFLTYHPDEWIATYIDYCSNSKGKAAGQEDPLTVALTEAKTIGYKIGKPDINYSDIETVVKEINGQKVIIPSLVSLKGVGKTAFSEIQQFRPYVKLEDLLINSNGSWRHSKFTKRALETLLKVEAFDSMGIIGEGKTFENYKQPYKVLLEHFDEYKRVASRKKNNDVKAHINDIITKLKQEDNFKESWTKEEKIAFSEELSGSVDMNLILTPQMQTILEEKNIPSIDDWSNGDDYCWMIVKNVVLATTKNKRFYLKIRVSGISGVESTVFVWNFKPKDPANPRPNIDKYSVVIGRLDKSKFGFESLQNKIKKLNG